MSLSGRYLVGEIFDFLGDAMLYMLVIFLLILFTLSMIGFAR